MSEELKTRMDVKRVLKDENADSFLRMDALDFAGEYKMYEFGDIIRRLLQHEDKGIRGTACKTVLMGWKHPGFLIDVIEVMKKEKAKFVLHNILGSFPGFIFEHQRDFYTEEILEAVLALLPEIDNEYLQEKIYATVAIAQNPALYWNWPMEDNWKDKVNWDLVKHLIPKYDGPPRELTGY